MKKPYFNQLDRMQIIEGKTLFAQRALMKIHLNRMFKPLNKVLMCIVEFLSKQLNKIM